MSAVWMTLIAVGGVTLVALVALRGNHCGFSGLASRMDSLERRMAVIESYLRPRQPSSPLPSPQAPEVTETPQLRALQETLEALHAAGHGKPAKYFDPSPAPVRSPGGDKPA